MSMHEEVLSQIHQKIESFGTAVALSATSVALAVQEHYMTQPAEPHLQYASLEHFKQLSRRALAGRYELDGEENQVNQNDMFAGYLQDRYPLARKKGEDPVYKLRDSMTEAELSWNVLQLRKSAKALLSHADALEAWTNRPRTMVAA